MVGIIRSPLGCCQCTEGQNIVWRYHFVIMTASVWGWERAATMVWELACQRFRRCGLSATARCAPPQTSRLPEGVRAATMCVGAGLPAIKTLRFVSDSPVRPPQTSPLPEGERAATMRWVWELASQRFRRCGLSATARCAPRRRARSQRGSGQQGCARCGSWLASD